MSRRRDFGAVRRLPSGRWQVRYRSFDNTMLTAPRTFATKVEATRWLATLEADRSRGLWVDPRAGKVMLDDYARQWLASKVRLAPRTKEIYADQLRLHILPSIVDDVPALGTVQLSSFTPELVRAWYGALLEARTPSVAAKAYTRLRQIMTQAVDDDRIAKNPCRIDGGGVERHPEQRFASLLELLDLAEAVADRYRALVITAGLTGLRQGELFALRRADVDLLHATVTVRRKRVRLSSGVAIEDDPKTAAGRRTVALPTPVVAELERHLATYTAAGADAYVFTGERGAPLDRNNFRARVWQPATTAVGLEGLRMHDLRHTAGTLAARTGATTKELMARLGHASPRAAMIYQHATADRDRLIADGLSVMAEEATQAKIIRIDTPRTGTDRK